MPSGRGRRTAVAPRAEVSVDRPRLVVAGATGRLGEAIVREAVRLHCPIVGGVRQEPAGGDRGDVPPGWPASVPLRGAGALPTLLGSADLLLTATTASAERTNLPLAAAAGVPAVVATTGLEVGESSWLEEVASRIPLVVDANFSIGVQLMRRAVRSLRPLPEGFDLSIVEAHRRGKLDRPSGTAKLLAEELRPDGRPSAVGAERGADRTEIASLRGGETPGVHTVWVAGTHELLRFEHVAYDRAAFAEGMLAAALWLHRRRGSLTPGIYSLADALEG